MTGCFKCELACQNAKNKGQLHRPYFDNNCNYICLVCTCQFSVVYYRQERKHLSGQMQAKLQEKMKKKPQQNIDVFAGFTNHPTNLIKDCYIQNEEGSMQSAMSLGMEDLIQSVKLQDNV